MAQVKGIADLGIFWAVLNEPPPGTQLPANVFSVSLSLEQEARQQDDDRVVRGEWSQLRHRVTSLGVL